MRLAPGLSISSLNNSNVCKYENPVIIPVTKINLPTPLYDIPPDTIILFEYLGSGLATFFIFLPFSDLNSSFPTLSIFIWFVFCLLFLYAFDP